MTLQPHGCKRLCPLMRQQPSLYALACRRCGAAVAAGLMISVHKLYGCRWHIKSSSKGGCRLLPLSVLDPDSQLGGMLISPKHLCSTL